MQETAVNTSNSVIEDLLLERLAEFESHTNSDAICFCGVIGFGVDDLLRDVIEGLDNKKSIISFIVESPGGYLTPVQRIAETLRHYYTTVNFFVPNYAMSAGTVLVMAGDDIYMDYYSMLGPIDPQVSTNDGKFVSATGYIREYDRLIEKSNDGNLSSAEIAFLLSKFDPGTLYQYKQDEAFAIALLQEWLAKYKFKNWTETETKRTKVDDEMRAATAETIGKKLTNPDLWHSHGRGISMKTLEDEVGLKIKDFAADAELDKRTRAYYRLLTDYRLRRDDRLTVHSRSGYNTWRV